MTPAPLDLEDLDLARAWSEFAADADQHARLIERLVDAGWTVTHWGCRARRPVDNVAEAAEIAAQADLFAPGHPIELCVADGDDSDPIGVGGLLVGHPAHPELSSPRTLPALIWSEPTGAQRIVEDREQLREAISRGLHDLALGLAEQQGQLHDLQAEDLPTAMRELADGLTAEAPVPRYVRVDMGAGHGLGAADPRLEVCAVSAAIWCGVAHAGNLGRTSITTPNGGIADQLFLLGEELATDLRRDEP